MNIVISLLHKYTALLDYCGHQRKQYIHLDKRSIEQLYESLKEVKGIKYSETETGESVVSLDGYDFVIIEK